MKRTLLVVLALLSLVGGLIAMTGTAAGAFPEDPWDQH